MADSSKPLTLTSPVPAVLPGSGAKAGAHNRPMNKRHFLGTAALAGLLPAIPASAAEPARKGPGLLTLSGAIGKSNRGPVDPALDQLMAKHGVKFDKAFVFDADALRRLPVVRIKPTLEYDAKVHSLAGPLLTSVAEAAGWWPATRCWPFARSTAMSCRCAWPTRAATG